MDDYEPEIGEVWDIKTMRRRDKPADEPAQKAPEKSKEDKEKE